MLVIALLGCWLHVRGRTLKSGVDASHIDLAMPLVFAVSMLGVQWFASFNPDDLEVTGGLFTTHARLSVFALLLFALPTLYLYARLTRLSSGLSSGLSYGTLLDLFALPVLGCLMLIRLGCFMAGCCWGDLVWQSPQLANTPDPGLATQVFTLPWLAAENLWTAVSFPAGSFAWRQHLALGLIGPEATGSLPVHPTQLYEFLLLAVLLCVLLRLEDRWISPGTTVLITLASYAVLRFFIEFLRADNAVVLGRLTFTQLICIALLIGCTMVMTAARRSA
jgi:phosphatidylglycerol:prolipoprotein diacylglycerol transferase